MKLRKVPKKYLRLFLIVALNIIFNNSPCLSPECPNIYLTCFLLRKVWIVSRFSLLTCNASLDTFYIKLMSSFDFFHKLLIVNILGQVLCTFLMYLMYSQIAFRKVYTCPPGKFENILLVNGLNSSWCHNFFSFLSKTNDWKMLSTTPLFFNGSSKYVFPAVIAFLSRAYCSRSFLRAGSSSRGEQGVGGALWALQLLSSPGDSSNSCLLLSPTFLANG